MADDVLSDEEFANWFTPLEALTRVSAVVGENNAPRDALIQRGCVPGSGVRTVDNWPAVATAQSQA